MRASVNVFYHLCTVEWERETNYCRKCVNISSRLNQAGVRRIINSRRDWSQSVFQYAATRSARTDQRPFHAEKLWVDSEKCRRKTEAEGSRQENSLYYSLDRHDSSRKASLAFERICQVGRFYGCFTRRAS